MLVSLLAYLQLGGGLRQTFAFKIKCSAKYQNGSTEQLDLTFVVVALLRRFEIPCHGVMQDNVGFPYSRGVELDLRHATELRPEQSSLVKLS